MRRWIQLTVFCEILIIAYLRSPANWPQSVIS